MANVVLVERGMRRLRYQDHPLPSPQTTAVDVSLPAGARADVLQHLTVLVVRVGSVEAIPAHHFVIVIVRHGDTESARGGECPESARHSSEDASPETSTTRRSRVQYSIADATAKILPARNIPRTDIGPRPLRPARAHRIHERRHRGSRGHHPTGVRPHRSLRQPQRRVLRAHRQRLDSKLLRRGDAGAGSADVQQPRELRARPARLERVREPRRARNAHAEARPLRRRAPSSLAVLQVSRVVRRARRSAPRAGILPQVQDQHPQADGPLRLLLHHRRWSQMPDALLRRRHPDGRSPRPSPLVRDEPRHQRRLAGPRHPVLRGRRLHGLHRPDPPFAPRVAASTPDSPNTVCPRSTSCTTKTPATAARPTPR